MAQAWGIQHATVTRATRDLQHNLGIVDQYKFGPKFTAGYNHAQQAEIRNYLAEQGYLNETSDGIRSITSLAVEWNMSRGTLAKVVQTAQAETDDFGEVGHYRTGSVPTSCLTDAQQSKVRAELEKRGLLNNETPEGVESLRSLIDNLETSYPRATALLDRLVKDGVIDEPAQYRFGSQFGIGLTAQQRAIVTKVMLEENAQIAPPPPEGVLSFKGLAEAMQVEYRGIRRAYNQLAEAGAVSADTYTFSRVQTVGLDKDAQRIVARELAERGAQQGVRTKAANFLQQLLAGQRPD
jgi:DNA-binding transcriptional regulator YhcF (GntR family)